jgi:hypothetical protein
MVRVPVYEYICHTGRGPIRVPTFKHGDHDGHRIAGHVVAPDGSGLRDAGQRAVLLRVPKEGRPGESWALNADDAREAAIRARDGLRWEPAGPMASGAGAIAHA